jgi:diguanylate cyclase (GGDEF)-like protein
MTDAATDASLSATVGSMLASVVDSTPLLTIQLHAPGAPELSRVVRRPVAEPLNELVAWPTVVAPGRWHDGLVVIATAPACSGECRAVVSQAARAIAELLGADRRVAQAESLARHASELAGIDSLTELGNRRTWRRALEDERKRAARRTRPTTIVVVDLDGLKQINDEQGHAAGDAYIQRCAVAVRSALRSIDIACRLGGDEFGVLAQETDAEGAAALRTRLSEFVARAGVAASIGVATTEEADLENAWQQADLDMYREKRRRGSREADARDVGAAGAP